MEFAGAFFGSLLGILVFHFIEARGFFRSKTPSVEAPVIPLKRPRKKKRTLTTSQIKATPHGSVVHAPTPEEVRETKRKEFEKRVYAPREEVVKDFR